MTQQPAVVCVLCALAFVGIAGASGAAPVPKAVAGAKVTVVARGVPTPTAFAFVGSQVLVSGFGGRGNSVVPGGVYLLKGGKAIRLPGSPDHAYGLAWHAGTLYVSDGPEILAWTGWNGAGFASSRTVVTGPEGFAGFNGIAYGPDGLLYAGVSVGGRKGDDYSRGTTPYANDVVSIDPVTGAIAVVGQGVRNPWQPAFVRGHKGPLVSDLGQDNLGHNRPRDEIVEAVGGHNFGFPSCPAKPTTCGKYAKPFAWFPPHASPMGLASIGGRLYVALYGGTGSGSEVVSMPAGGGSFKPFLTGYPARVLALGAYAGRVYSGDVSGTVYSVEG